MISLFTKVIIGLSCIPLPRGYDNNHTVHLVFHDKPLYRSPSVPTVQPYPYAYVEYAYCSSVKPALCWNSNYQWNLPVHIAERLLSTV